MFKNIKLYKGGYYKRNMAKSTLIMATLILVIVILLAIILTFLVIKPMFNNYVLEKQIEAKDIVLGSMLVQIQQQGYTQISDNSGNTLVLVPYTPQNNAQQQQLQTLEQQE